MSTADTGVAPATEQRLRDAMGRLLAGRATRTDGRLTKTNLAREAGVSRATMNRATTVMTEWATVVTDRRPRSPDLSRLEDKVQSLQATIKDLRVKNADLRTQGQAAATVIAELHAQLQAARHQEPGGTVTALAPHGRQHSRW